MRRWSVVTNILAGIVVAAITWWITASVHDNREKIEEVRTEALTTQERGWADLLQYHASWYPEKGGIWQHVKFLPHESCSNIILQKTIRQVKDGAVTGPMIEASGELQKQMLNVEPGGEPTDLFDVATPKTPLGPGKYQITLVATCERDLGLQSGPINLRTLPFSATFTVPQPVTPMLRPSANPSAEKR